MRQRAEVSPVFWQSVPCIENTFVTGILHYGRVRVSAINKTHIRFNDGPSSYACHTGLTTGGGSVLPSQSACSPRSPWPVTRGRSRLEWGRLGEMIYWRPLYPGHRLVTLFPVLNLRRHLPRLDDVVGPSLTASWTLFWCPPSE